jgi:tetratricopeptide repeat protein
MKSVAVFFLLPALLLAQPEHKSETSSQTSTGKCNPNIVSSGSGQVKVEITDACNDDPQALRSLTEKVQKLVGKYPKIIDRLQELLNKDDVELAQKAQEVDDWIKRFNELSAQLGQSPADGELSKREADALHNGDLALAERLQKELIAREEDLTAQNQFNLGQLLELRFEPTEALAQYKKAYDYRSEDVRYGQAYGDLLGRQNRYAEAIRIYEHVLKIRRELASANPHAYQPDLARTQNDLGLLYTEMQRFKDAEKTTREALQTFRDLAKANPHTYQNDIAVTLNDLGDLYSEMQRPKDAEDAYTEELQTFRDLANSNPQAYKPYIALALDNLGLLYGNTQRTKQAEDAYTEALQIQRDLAKANTQAYSLLVAVTLDNLGFLYSNSQRPTKAEAKYMEALQTFRDLASANPQAYSPYVAVALNNLGKLYLAEGQKSEATPFCSEAASIYKQLVTDNPVTYGPLEQTVCVQQSNLMQTEIMPPLPTIP